MLGVSGPFPSLDRAIAIAEDPALNVYPPSSAIDSHALACTRSLSPRRSKMRGKRVVKTVRRVDVSITPKNNLTLEYHNKEYTHHSGQEL